MTYLVTGAAGFIGARFVESCRARGIDVISVDEPKYFRERKENASLDFGRIIDREKLFDVLAAEKLPLQAIIHLGACANTFELNEEYLRKMNLDYSKRLWDIACDRGVPMVYASSAATYGDGSLGYDDDDALIARLHPLNPYGESKRLFDLHALAEEKRSHQPPAWSGFKFFNVYGFGERHKGKMASVVLHGRDQILATGQMKLFRSHRAGIADGEQKRDFIHVDDVVSVLHFALEKPIRRGIFNLGTGQARSFLDLARAVFKAMGREEKIQFIDTPEALRERYQYFTEARMERLRAAGYTKPFASLEEGVKRYLARLGS